MQRWCRELNSRHFDDLNDNEGVARDRTRIGRTAPLHLAIQPHVIMYQFAAGRCTVQGR